MGNPTPIPIENQRPIGSARYAYNFEGFTLFASRVLLRIHLYCNHENLRIGTA